MNNLQQEVASIFPIFDKTSLLQIDRATRKIDFFFIIEKL
jgi:hypothetical protein